MENETFVVMPLSVGRRTCVPAPAKVHPASP